MSDEIKGVKHAQQCMDSGELDDFNQELEYILSTLLKEDATTNLKYLSTVQLAKKCVSGRFRKFLRSQNTLEKIFQAFSDEAPNSPALSLVVSIIIYFLARDQKSVPITDVSIRLIADLLRQEPPKNPTDEFKKQSKMLWGIIKEWLAVSAERTTKSIQFDVTEETFSSSFLMLEALAYISVKEHGAFFKIELLNSGCLQGVLARFDKALLTMSYSATTKTELNSKFLLNLKEIERCCRILENAAAFNKKNQAYLISHRNGLLLISCAKFFELFKKLIEMDDVARSAENKILDQLLDCVCLSARVLMNVSHENELCCLKLGNIKDFLPNCIFTLTDVAPRFSTNEKFFDLCVMMYGLLVNMVERCSSNRQKIIDYKVKLFDSQTKTSSQCSILEAFSKLFVKHDTLARNLDEELDNDLIFEEAMMEDEADQDSGGLLPNCTKSNGGRLNRQVELSEDEIVNVMRSAMNKASAHMEDSMLSSYIALLVGCIIDTDESLAEEVKRFMVDKNLKVMIEQLERYLEFMKITNLKSTSTGSIERIIQSMQVANGL